MSFDIDFVVTWVDGNDPLWRADKNRFIPGANTDTRDERYRDMGIMHYWFRAVEAFAPWVRKIHFVTWGHVPAWLDTENPKIQIVRHEDYLPEEVLPVFNCNVLELALHKIPDLAEHFVYFNDDMLLNAPCKPDDFFEEKSGLPRDLLAFQPVVANPKNPVMSNLLLNNSLLICRHFNKRENVKKQPGAYFHIGYPPLYFFYNMLELGFPLYTGLYDVHGPAMLLKSTYEELWEKEGDALYDTLTHRFRDSSDLTIYLLRDWQKLTGKFVPTNIQKFLAYFNLGDDTTAVEKAIKKQQKKVICLNDGSDISDYDALARKMRQIYQEKHPEKSAFEK